MPPPKERPPVPEVLLPPWATLPNSVLSITVSVALFSMAPPKASPLNEPEEFVLPLPPIAWLPVNRLSIIVIIPPKKLLMPPPPATFAYCVSRQCPCRQWPCWRSM